MRRAERILRRPADPQAQREAAEQWRTFAATDPAFRAWVRPAEGSDAPTAVGFDIGFKNGWECQVASDDDAGGDDLGRPRWRAVGDDTAVVQVELDRFLRELHRPE